ncbi:unnamed protein product, partial [marine sediment metagenome]
CEYLEQISVKCTPCLENKLGACHIKLGLQEYYPKDYALYDTIEIIRHNTRLSVETDIEVKYKTDYPYGAFAGKGPEWERECTKKVGKIRDCLEPKLPPGVRFGTFHVHYHPDKYDPNIVPIHIHAQKSVEDLDEAKDLVGKLSEAIRPGEIEALI